MPKIFRTSKASLRRHTSLKPYSDCRTQAAKQEDAILEQWLKEQLSPTKKIKVPVNTTERPAGQEILEAFNNLKVTEDKKTKLK